MTDRGVGRHRRLQIDKISKILRIIAFIPVVVACVYFLIFHPAPPAIAVIDATTESISFDVTLSDFAQIRLDGFSVFYEDPETAVDLFSRTVGSSAGR
jgi:hypothetical protein